MQVIDMTDTLLIIVTISSGFLVVYHHVGYPLILRLVQRFKSEQKVEVAGRRYTDTANDIKLPSITLVMPAYNEEQWIAEKIRNLSVLDYPANRLDVIIACDGCSDNTASIAQQTVKEPNCLHLNVKILDFESNRGKVAVINDIMRNIDSELVVMSDVSALISIDALLIAGEHFKDENIGVLNGHYRMLNPGSKGEAAYWNYQSKIKASEATMGSTLGAHGAFYLFRRALFQPLPEDTINDDFILPMKIVAAGYRAGYENRINAVELEQADGAMDHKRRRRIAAGNCQQLLRLKKLLLPNNGAVSFAFVSGKGLRVLMPFLMIIALIGSLMLSGNYQLFAALAILQSLAYLLACWQLLVQPKRSNKIIQTIAYLVGGHFAGMIGTLRYIFGLESGRWKRVD
jgi:cellulose synthase/poly-beta-1,6-N-acetylglucosamine synthase-like glycosyltransferase